MERSDFFKTTKPLVFGHRGFSALAPENTLSAFALCVEKGIEAVEFDVHECKSGELVIIHDHSLQRVAQVEGVVEESDYKFLASLDVGSHKGPEFAGEKIPLLSELFEQFGSALLYDIELKTYEKKDSGLALKTYNLIKQFKLENRCLISSFNPFAVRWFNRVSQGTIPTAIIYSETKELPKMFHHGWGRHIAKASMLKPDYLQVDAQSIAKLQQRRGYPMIAWTVNSATECRRLLDLGIDGLIGDDPLMLLDEVQAHTNGRVRE